MKNRLKIISLICTFVFFLLSTATAKDVNSYAQMASRIKPSVVTILIYEYSGKLKGYGSGFFYNDNGDIVTNNHVLKPNTTAKIKTSTGKTYTVLSIIERDKKTDYAKASTDYPTPSPFLEIARTAPLVGDKIVVAGAPKGFEQTISDGIVSAWRDLGPKGRVIQISAPISPGSSGGPVLNMQAKVVGISTYQYKTGQNLNFAVPINRIFKTKHTKPTKLKIHKGSDGIIIIQ